MLVWVTLALFAVTIVTGLGAVVVSERILTQRWGRTVLLIGAVFAPLLVSATGLLVGVQKSSTTTFCLECHEMEDYGKSMFVDNTEALSAVHYQKRLITRESTCYACHTDYAMFGDVKAKMNGLKHVWVHYLGDIPASGQMKLYAPYANRNCLHCHDDARSYLEVSEHLEDREKIRSGATSCLTCHEVGHDLQGVKDQNFWLGVPK